MANSNYDPIGNVITGLDLFTGLGARGVDAAHDIISCGQPYGMALTDEQIAKLTAAWAIFV